VHAELCNLKADYLLEENKFMEGKFFKILWDEVPQVSVPAPPLPDFFFIEEIVGLKWPIILILERQ
jgi:hypothetical protein